MAKVTLSAQSDAKQHEIEAAFAGREMDLAKAMRRVPIVPCAPVIPYPQALVKALPSKSACDILEQNFNSSVNASKILHTANIVNMLLSKDDLFEKSILELGPGQFAFSLIARELGAYVTILDKNDFFIDVAEILDFSSYKLNYYTCPASDVKSRFDGLWLKGSYSPLLPGGEDMIERIASKLTGWINEDGWGFVAPNAKAAKFEQRFGSGYETLMHRLIEAQRDSMEALGWISVSLSHERRRYLGLASAAYDATRYLFVRNLDISRLSALT